MLATYHFSLPDMVCINCIRPMEAVLRECDTIHIKNMDIDVVAKRVAIQVVIPSAPIDVSKVLRDRMEGVGITCVDLNDSTPDAMTVSLAHSSYDASSHLINQKKKIRWHWVQGLLGSTFGIALLILAICGGSMPVITMYLIFSASLLLTLGLGAGSYYEAVKQLIKAKVFTMEALFTVSTVTAVGVSIASFFYPWLPLMCEAGPLIFGFRHIGQAIESSIKQKFISALTFRQRIPQEVEVGDALHLKPVSQLIPGETIVVRRGQMIPVDGTCLSETSLVYDTVLTGSTLPRFIKQGEPVCAGMTVAEDAASIKIKVIAQEGHSYLARLDEKMMQVNMEKAPIETVANQALQYFVPIVLGLAMVSGITIGVMFTPALAIQCAIAVLVSACPCTLGFITPLAIKIGITKAAQHGVQFKSSKALQSADPIDTVVFDLNGTLTAGRPFVYSYQMTAQSDLSSEEWLHYVALLESESQHPIAKAICRFVEEKKLCSCLPLKMTDLDQSHGSGVCATINGQPFILGNKTMMLAKGIDVSSLPVSQQQQAEHMIYLARGEKVLGYILLHDPIRDDAKQMMAELKRMKKKVYICTGAAQETAEYYAEQLGVPNDQVRAHCVGVSTGLSVATKIDYIEQLQRQGCRVAMVGDAANDALAMAGSDFALAMQSTVSDEVTQQQAHAVVQRHSLMPVVTAFAVAHQTVRHIKQNLIMSLTYNVAAVLIAGGLLVGIGVVLNPGVGVALMVLQTSLILLNAYRFKQKALSHLKRQEALQQLKKVECGKTTYHHLQVNMPSKTRSVASELSLHGPIQSGSSPTFQRRPSLFSLPGASSSSHIERHRQSVRFPIYR